MAVEKALLFPRTTLSCRQMLSIPSFQLVLQVNSKLFFPTIWRENGRLIYVPLDWLAALQEWMPFVSGGDCIWWACDSLNKITVFFFLSMKLAEGLVNKFPSAQTDEETC